MDRRELAGRGSPVTAARRAILGILAASKYPHQRIRTPGHSQEGAQAGDLVAAYRPRRTSGGRFRYEAHAGRAQPHIRCHKCEKIADLMLCLLKKIAAPAEEETRFLIEGM